MTRANHKKGIAAADKARKRAEAEARNAKFQALSQPLKVVGQSDRVRAKYDADRQINNLLGDE